MKRIILKERMDTKVNTTVQTKEGIHHYSVLTRTSLQAGCKINNYFWQHLCRPGLVALSIMGNTLAISKLLRKRMRKKRTTTLFLHLALADCMVTIFPMAGRGQWNTNKTWNNFFCILIIEELLKPSEKFFNNLTDSQ